MLTFVSCVQAIILFSLPHVGSVKKIKGSLLLRGVLPCLSYLLRFMLMNAEPKRELKPLCSSLSALVKGKSEPCGEVARFGCADEDCFKRIVLKSGVLPKRRMCALSAWAVMFYLKRGCGTCVRPLHVAVPTYWRLLIVFY